MSDYIKLILLGVVAVIAAIAANYGRDLAYTVNMAIVMVFAASFFIYYLRRTDEPQAGVEPSAGMGAAL